VACGATQKGEFEALRKIELGRKKLKWWNPQGEKGGSQDKWKEQASFWGLLTNSISDLECS